MFSIINQLELRKVIISSLITCIYLPTIVTIISYKDLLYTVGNGSSFYVLVLIFLAELLKSFYLTSASEVSMKRKGNKTRAGDILKSFVFLLGVIFCFFIGIVLFGAPFFESHEETLMLSSLLMLLTVFPLIAHSGIESAMQLLFGVKNYNQGTIIAMLVTNALWTIGGAWLGAIVIPLDWNKPWQQWPIPCYLGAVFGYLLSNVKRVVSYTFLYTLNKYPICKNVANHLNYVYMSK